VTAPERWLPVPGFEGLYEVSDQGRARSLPHRVKIHHGATRLSPGRVLKPGPASKYGHLRVTLCREHETYPIQVHQLVMLAFVGPCPDGMEVRHLDSNPANNALSNLTYGTRAENAQDRVQNGTDNNARKTHCPTCSLPYDEVNTYWYKGARQCKNCRSRRSREQQQGPSADLSPAELEDRRTLARERTRRYRERQRANALSD
jgi:hypothetical protein